jgi:hypothetical protein
MWKILYQSVPGTSHQIAGLPCQDCCAAREIKLAAETVLILACSDGAGSAEFSEIGSKLACQTLVDRVAAEVQAGDKLAAVEADRALDWVALVHEALGVEAEVRSVEVRQFACTLLFALLGERGAAFGQIGDGAIVQFREDEYRSVFWPQSGEYINTTNFITNPNYRSAFEFAWCDAPVDEVALFSDGLQMVGLDFQKHQAHGPFFAPLFHSLRKQADAAELVEPMRAFLQSPQLAERTDDDKTLILATRLAPLTIPS